MLDMINEWNFPVEKQPVFDQFGNAIEGSQCVMRTDTNEVLGVHGSRYHVVPHDDVVNSIMDAVSAANLSQDYSLKTSVIEGGRKLRGEILFNDLKVEPAVGDYVKFRVSFFNSYDGSWSFSQAADGLRLWCLNGCTTPIGTARSKFKHTQSINVEGSAQKIGIGLDAFMNNKDEWQKWMNVHVTDQMAELFFKHTIAKSPSRQALVHKANEKQLEKLLGIWSNEKRALGPNKWALYNAMTYWASHTNDLKNPEVARRNREDAIAKAMNNNRFTQIEVMEMF
jgi:hypothetical protein